MASQKVSVPLTIGNLKALRNRPMQAMGQGKTSVTQAMRDQNGVVTDYKIELDNGKVVGVRPIKRAFKGKISQTAVDRRNEVIMARRKKKRNIRGLLGKRPERITRRGTAQVFPKSRQEVVRNIKELPQSVSALFGRRRRFRPATGTRKGIGGRIRATPTPAPQTRAAEPDSLLTDIEKLEKRKRKFGRLFGR